MEPSPTAADVDAWCIVSGKKKKKKKTAAAKPPRKREDLQGKNRQETAAGSTDSDKASVSDQAGRGEVMNQQRWAMLTK